MLALAAATAYIRGPKLHGEGQAPPGSGDWLDVQQGDFEVICEEQGELHPLQVTSLASPTTGNLAFIVPEGVVVKKGDKVFSLETAQLEDRQRQLHDELASAQLNLAQQQQSRELSLKQFAVDLSAQKDTTSLAQLKEEDMLSHPQPVDKDDAANILNQAQVNLDAATTSYTIVRDLAEKGFDSGSDVRSKEVAMKIAGVARERAQISDDKLLAGALPIDRAKGALSRESSALDLSVLELNQKDQTEDFNLQVKMAEHAVAAAQHKLDRCNQDLERSVVRAPHDGVVVLRIVDDRLNKKAEVGDRVGPWRSPVDLPNYAKMKVRTQVPESFVQQLAPRRSADSTLGAAAGSRAFVSVKTLPDKEYPAETIWIDGWAHDRNEKLADADAKAQGMAGVQIFPVEVELLESDTERLRDGFQATVDFPGQTLKNVLSMPLAAIQRRDGGSFVQVAAGSATEWRKIELGAQPQTGRRVGAPHAPGQRANEVVVVSGVSVGERVLIQAEAPQAATSKDEKKPAKASTPANAAPADPNAGSPPAPGDRPRKGSKP